MLRFSFQQIKVSVQFGFRMLELFRLLFSPVAALRGMFGLLSYIMRSLSEESLMFRLVLITVINTSELPGRSSYSVYLPLMSLFSNPATTSLFSALSPDNNLLHLPPPSPPSACSTRSVRISSCQLLPEAVTVRVFMPCGF